jgi:exonuclease SbcC
VAWNNLREVEKEYEAEKRVFEKDYDTVGIEKLEADYHETVKDLASVDGEITEYRTRLQQAEMNLQTASTRLGSLEELRKETENLLKKEAETQANIVNSEGNCARLAGEVQRKQKAVDEFRKQLDTIEARVGAQRSQLQEIGFNPQLTTENLRGRIESFDGQMTGIKAEQEAARKENQTSEQRLSSLTAGSKCPLCLRPLTDNYKTHMLKHIEEERAEREKRLEELQKNIRELEALRNTASKALSDFQSYIPQMETLRDRIVEERESKERLEKEHQVQLSQGRSLQVQLESVRREIAKFDTAKLEDARKLHENALDQYHSAKAKLGMCEGRKKDVSLRVEDLRERLERAQHKVDRVKKIEGLLETVHGIRDAYRSIQPKLRTEFVRILERVVQQVLDNLLGEEGSALFASIDETYTPSIKSQDGYEREVSYISGGERTLLAFAYRFALGQLVMQARTGHGLQMLLLDEPTESLGREDKSVDRLAEAISRLKAIEQIIAVTHDEAFAEKAEYVVRLEKEATISKVFAER